MSATDVPEIVQLVFNMEILAISSMSEVRSEHKICFRASYVQRVFEQHKNHLRSVTSKLPQGPKKPPHSLLYYWRHHSYSFGLNGAVQPGGTKGHRQTQPVTK